MKSITIGPATLICGEAKALLQGLWDRMQAKGGAGDDHH